MTRQQINDYATAAIALILMAAICWYVSTSQTSTALKKLERTVQTTDTQTKEVKQIEPVYRTVVKQNDAAVQQKVEEARNNVPDDLDALIDLANDIINESARALPCARTNNQNKR